MTDVQPARDVQGIIFDVDTFAIHDGPGIRMAVYLKGCPLGCKWCHSPESQHAAPEMIFLRDRCTLCGTCVAVCPHGVHHLEDPKGFSKPLGSHRIERELCQVCGRCVEACPRGALATKGYAISASTLVAKAERMRPFFQHSGGGVTLTGGEVTLQADFAAALLAGCRSLGISTAIETSGACRWERLAQLLAHTDLVLYDLKLIDDDAHRHWIGASNRQILDNAARLAGHNVQVRVPLIPGITDTDENIRGILAFARTLGLKSVAFLPYNPSSAAKYEWLSQAYEIEGLPQSHEALAHLLALAHEVGIEAVIG